MVLIFFFISEFKLLKANLLATYILSFVIYLFIFLRHSLLWS